MTTALSLVESALSTLNVKKAGQSLDPDDAQLGLDRLNDLLDSWAIESLYAFSTTEYSATVNAATVTIGPTGTIVTPYVPTRIEGAFTRQADIDYPITLVNYLDFADIAMKSTVGPFPQIGYYNGTGTLTLYPVPSSIALHVSVYERLSEFATLLTSYTLRPGVRRALHLSLAEELADPFAVPIRPSTVQLASKARKNLKRSNHFVPQMDTVIESGFNLYPPGFSGDNYDGAIDPT